MTSSHVKKIAVLGFAREGTAILKFLKKNPVYANSEIWILDKNSKIKIPAGLKKQTGKKYLKNIGQFDIVFRSPGIPYNLPEIQNAKRHGTTISSGTKLFFDLTRRPTQIARRRTQKLVSVSRRPVSVSQRPIIIGVTGTKGKGTTCMLLYKILKAHSTDSGQAGGKRVFLAGNIGKPAMEILPRLLALGRRKSASSLRKSAPVVILELSSFQLQDLDVSPQIAAVLDTFPDHQDSHKNLTEYYGAKANIALHQKVGDKIFYFPDNKKSAWIADKSRGKKIGVIPEKFKLFSPADIKMPGYHNFKNAAMAAAVARALGVSEKIILHTIKNFMGAEHRLEFIRRLTLTPRRTTQKKLYVLMTGRRKSAYSQRQSATVEFYNDSASTNPHTAAAAVKAFSSSTTYYLQPTTYNLILIAGGKDKNLDYSPLAQALKNSPTKLVVLMGENRRKIAKAFARIKNNELRIKTVKNLPTAVSVAYAAAKKPLIHNSSFIILFSPGAASFDMFHDYADRGRQFKKLVNKL